MTKTTMLQLAMFCQRVLTCSPMSVLVVQQQDQEDQRRRQQRHGHHLDEHGDGDRAARPGSGTTAPAVSSMTR